MGRADHLAQYKWTPGKGGPGRPPMSDDEKALRRFTRDHVGEVINKLMELTDSEITLLFSDPSVPQFEKLVAKVMLTARQDGNFSPIDSLLDRCIGRVPQKTEHSGPEGAPLVPPVINYNPVQQIPSSPSQQIPSSGSPTPIQQPSTSSENKSPTNEK